MHMTAVRLTTTNIRDCIDRYSSEQLKSCNEKKTVTKSLSTQFWGESGLELNTYIV